jgi:signal transduction histidine kinase
MIRRSIRNVIIGKDNYIQSQTDFKHVIISGVLILIAIPAVTPFAIIDFTYGYHETLCIYLACIEFLLFALLLHRSNHHLLAKNLVLITLNITVYLFATSDPVGTGTRTFFALFALAPFALFSDREKLWTVIHVCATFLFYTVSYLQDHTILSYRPYSETEILINDLTSVAVSIIGCSIFLLVLKSMNEYHAHLLKQQTENLLQENLELDRFVYSTSHDLRAPLTSMKGLIHLTTLTNDQKEIENYLSLMQTRVNKLDKFINDITSYSRNSRQLITFEEINIASLTDDIWQDLQHADDAKSITLRVDVDPDDHIVADRQRLGIILSNLFSNAIRYHDKRKKERFISLQHISSGDASYIKVEDNGQGIAKEHQAKIFDMFFRADERSNGSGLGLYIVKEAVQKMSGHIHLESTPGVGSCFTIRIPKTDTTS